MKEYIFYVDKINEKFPGISKIIDNIIPVFKTIKVVNSLEGITENNKEIVPVGTVAAYFYLKKYSEGGVAFIIDAYSLGYLSISKFYFRRGNILNKYFIGAALRYVKYYFIEKRIIKRFDKIIVVSEHDADYLRKNFKTNKVAVVANGVDPVDQTKSQSKDFDFTFGILSYWGAGSLKDVNWFIEDYMPKLRLRYPNIKLVTAGRAADDTTLRYFKEHGVDHMGEVEDLWQFFNRIDIYITTLRKECGILNKVLDAMMHKKIVVGLEHNMYAFKNLKNGFYTYKNIDELYEVIDEIIAEPYQKEKIENAHSYLLENHDWVKNYSRLKEMIDDYIKVNQN